VDDLLDPNAINRPVTELVPNHVADTVHIDDLADEDETEPSASEPLHEVRAFQTISKSKSKSKKKKKKKSSNK
jgi:hypothetical protein